MKGSLKTGRRNTLIKDGFTKWEAQKLSRNSITSPAMMELRKERRAIMYDFIMEHSARELSGHKVKKFSTDYTAYIYDLYKKANWFTNTGERNPFGRLREIADRMHIQVPNWRELYTGLSSSRRKSRLAKGEYKNRATKTRSKKIEQDEKSAAQHQAAVEQKKAYKRLRLKLSEVD